jgi:hypothetical protein
MSAASPVRLHADSAARGAPSPRLRLTRPSPKEGELHEAVAKLLGFGLLMPAEWTCFPAGNVELDARSASKLFRYGLKRGWPDFIIVFGGRVHGLELKRRGEELSKSRWVRSKKGGLRWVEGQDTVHPRLEDAGMRLGVCDSIDSVIATLKAWGLPLRRGIR